MERFTLLDWILPEGCALCGLPVPGGGFGVCDSCRGALPRIPRECCKLCGASLAGAAAHSGAGRGMCMRCRGGQGETEVSQPSVICRGAFEYSEELAFLLARYKANRDRRLARWIAREVAVLCRREWPGLMITPVPGSPANVRRRGWDHMREVSRVLEDEGFPVIDLLRRRRGPEQKGLARGER